MKENYIFLLYKYGQQKTFSWDLIMKKDPIYDSEP